VRLLPRSLRYRIAAAIFALEAVMMTVVIWQTTAFTRDATASQIRDMEQVTLDLLAGTARVALLTEEYDRFQPYLEHALRDPHVVRILLADERGRVVAASEQSRVGEGLPALRDGAETYWRRRELANETGPLGVLAVEFSAAPLVRIHAQARNLGIAIGLAGMAVIAVVGVGFGMLLTRRLERVMAAAEAVAAGALDRRSGVRGDDEVGALGAAFDAMAERLAAERAELERGREALERRVRERTAELERTNHELESFVSAVSHDLRAPLRAVQGFAEALLEDHGDRLPPEARGYLDRMHGAATRMTELIEDLLLLSRVSRSRLERVRVDFSRLAGEVVQELRAGEPDRAAAVEIEPGIEAHADPRLLRIALVNLIGNAWKFTRGRDPARIQVALDTHEGEPCVCVRDNGAGFDPRYAHKLFQPFQRLHSTQQFEGSGVGLSTVQRIVHMHGGRIWAEGREGEGATFCFTLGPGALGRRMRGVGAAGGMEA